MIELQRFLGMVNYYHRFLPQAAKIMVPLHRVLDVHPKAKNNIVPWDLESSQAFQNTTELLAHAALLAHPNAEAALAIITDASDLAVGAALQQRKQGGTWQPLSFFSRKLRDAETRYSTYDKELLAVFLAVKHFLPQVEGREFTIFTDHKPLTFSLAKKTTPILARQQRHLAFIAEYTSDIRHVSGQDNVAADSLSRAPVVSGVSLGIDYERLAADQEADDEYITCQKACPALRWEKIELSSEGPKLLCDVSTNQPRPWLPLAWRSRVFHLIHDTAHPGANGTIKLISKRFVWHGMAKDVRQWSKVCVSCQRSKIHRHVKSDLSAFQLPATRFAQVHVDLIGPLPSSNGFQYLLTMVDRYTRWPEAVPVSDITAETCAKAFLGAWVARFGVPSHITSDRGNQFTSGIWTHLGEALGVDVHRTTAYHPQANGMVERFHRQLKSSLTARLSSSAWARDLPWVLLELRTLPKEDLGCSPAEAVYGSTLRLPGEFVQDAASEIPSLRLAQLRDKLIDLMPAPPRWTKKANSNHPTRMPASLDNAKFVFVRVDTVKPPLSCQYDGP